LSHTSSLFCHDYFEDGVMWTICPCSPRITIQSELPSSWYYRCEPLEPGSCIDFYWSLRGSEYQVPLQDPAHREWLTKVENEFRHVSIITVYMPKNISQGEKFSKCYEVRMTLQWAKGNSQSK
jgi:hypothetical protein